ncbi:MAG: T9SS type A sorting domain-containing protein [Bacteroidetes bacterium]|nr:T9SS type A sorting domain-containing protein [Bacteroidota bacterium]
MKTQPTAANHLFNYSSLTFRLILIFHFSFFIFHSSFSQNLVPNPSFEEYTECPDGQCQIMRATGWMSFGYTPDYCNSCCIFNSFSTPNNAFGFQVPADGSAYAVFGCYSETSNIREYIGIELIEPLAVGVKYCFSMKVSLSIKTYGSNIAINRIGALFTNVSYDLGEDSCSSVPSGLNPPRNFAHVYSDSIITDTANWVSIRGTFVADSAYKYIVIGNFFDNTHTQYLVLGDTIVNIKLSYYYFDEIFLGIDTVSATHTSQDVNLSINPNPVGDCFFVKPNVLTTEGWFYLFDIYGQECMRFQCHNKTTKVMTNRIPSGIYFLRYYNDSVTFSKKIIIAH